MKAWSCYSYSDGIKFCRGYSAEEIQKANTVLQTQNLTDKMMNGYSIENLPFKYEGPLQQLNYSKVFYEVLQEGYLTPASYIMRLIHECDKYFDNIGVIIGIIGRGLRSFPAFLREMDLPDKLANHLKDAIAYRSNPEEDIIDHTDIYLKYEGECYHVWSYQNTSERAILNTISKLRGDRGELPSGLHLLCPFNYQDSSQYEDICGWRLYHKDYAERIKALIHNSIIDNYDRIMMQDEDFLKLYITIPQIFRKQ